MCTELLFKQSNRKTCFSNKTAAVLLSPALPSLGGVFIPCSQRCVTGLSGLPGVRIESYTFLYLLLAANAAAAGIKIGTKYMSIVRV